MRLPDSLHLVLQLGKHPLKSSCVSKTHDLSVQLHAAVKTRTWNLQLERCLIVQTPMECHDEHCVPCLLLTSMRACTVNMMCACCTFWCAAVLPMCVICPQRINNWQTNLFICMLKVLSQFLLCPGSTTACERKPTLLTLICMCMLHTARHTHDCLQPVLQINKAAAQ